MRPIITETMKWIPIRVAKICKLNITLLRRSVGRSIAGRVGGLVPGLELKSIFLGVSQSRNPNLAAVFYRMRLIESYGTGIGKIERAYKSCPMQPEFETAKGVFRVTLPNRNEVQETGGKAQPGEGCSTSA